MDKVEEKIDLIRKTNDVISRILGGTPEQLIRETDLGTVLSFRPAEESFVGIFKIVDQLAKSQLKVIPYQKLNQIFSTLNRVIELTSYIYSFSPNTVTNISRDGIINQAEGIYNELYNLVTPILYHIRREQNDYEPQQKLIKDTISSVEFAYNEILKKKESILIEAEAILKNLRETASESGVTKHSEIFAEEAAENKKKANHWLGTVILTGLASIGIAYYFLTLIPNSTQPSNYEIVHFAITKLLVFTFLYYMMLMFVKNYNAQRHNYVVNKHRQNALTTFGTFVNSTKDNDTKNAVLLQTTHSIFSAQNSGYIKNENDNEPTQKLVEIIRAGSSSLNQK